MTPIASLPEAALVVFLAACCAASAVHADQPDGRRLSDLVRQDCGSCHGLTMRGGLGRPLTPQALSEWSEPALEAVILDGVPGTPMPPWRPLLTPAEAAWIAQNLKSGRLE